MTQKVFLNAFTNSKFFGITKNNFFFRNFSEIYFVSNNNKINYIFLSLLNSFGIFIFLYKAEVLSIFEV